MRRQPGSASSRAPRVSRWTRFVYGRCPAQVPSRSDAQPRPVQELPRRARRQAAGEGGDRQPTMPPNLRLRHGRSTGRKWPAYACPTQRGFHAYLGMRSNDRGGHRTTSASQRPAGSHPPKTVMCGDAAEAVCLVVASEYSMPDGTLALLAAIVVESVAKEHKTEAA